MLEERFLDAAVKIKREFLKVSSDISKYEARVRITLDRLNAALAKVEAIKKDIDSKEKRKTAGAKETLDKMLAIVDEIEAEGSSIEKFVDPMNKEIERLAIEEQELYRMIKNRHPELTEKEIVESVSERLKKENLL